MATTVTSGEPKQVDQTAEGKSRQSAEEFLALARRRFMTCVGAESRMREKMHQDMKFSNSEQWDERDKRSRLADGRPCLTINRIPQFIRQVTNQQRITRPAIQVNPIDSAADPNTAEAIQGVMRSIETNSDADIAYATGCEHQTTIGRGFWRILTEYSDDDGFEQNIVIAPIPDAFSVYVDPSHKRVDGADARYTFVVSDIPKDEFEAQYGKDKASTLNAWLGSSPDRSTWAPEGKYRVAEYFYKETNKKTIVEVRIPAIEPDRQGQFDKVKIPKEVLPPADQRPAGFEVLNERVVDEVIVKWATITPAEILEGNDGLTAGREFPCKYIPIIQVLGDKVVLDGEVDLKGMVRDAKDPQRMLSFWASNITEQIGVSSRAPYIGVEGQFKGHEAKWNQAHRRNFAYLEVAPVSIGGTPAPYPERQQFEPNIQAMVQAFMLADNDLKAVMGLYDASLGKSGPEQSGKAILARQRQGEVGNSNYLDNLGRAIRHTGRIILDMIPRVYTPARIVRILGADNEQQSVLISNGASEQDIEALKASTGIEKIYDISVGRYDVSISTGPSYTSRRQEAVEAMLQLLNANPDIAPIISDLMIKNMDWPGAAEISARLKRMVPPQALGEKEGGPPPIPPEIQQHIQELEQQVAKLQTGEEVKKLKIQTDQEMAEKELAVEVQKMQLDHQAAMIQAQARVSEQRAEAMIRVEMEKTKHQLEQNVRLLLAKRDNETELTIAELDAKVDEKVGLEKVKSQTKVGLAQAKAQASADAGDE